VLFRSRDRGRSYRYLFSIARMYVLHNFRMLDLREEQIKKQSLIFQNC
jgi:hypothetical protein